MLNKAAFIVMLFTTAVLTGCSLMQAQLRSDTEPTTSAKSNNNNISNNDSYNDGLLTNSPRPTTTTNHSAVAPSTMTNSGANSAPGQGSITTAPSVFPQNQNNGEYLIGPQDLIEIQVFGVEELYRKVRVNSRGSISLPLIGNIQAAGLTSEKLETRIANELAKNYLQDPQVTVFIQEFTNLRVTVEGAVKKPGIFPLQGQTTLLQSIALAEGPDRLASSVVKIFRVQPSGSRKALQFDLDEIRGGDIPDPLLTGDDIVVVETSTGKSVLHGVTDTLRGFVRPFGF